MELTELIDNATRHADIAEETFLRPYNSIIQNQISLLAVERVRLRSQIDNVNAQLIALEFRLARLTKKNGE